MVLMTSVVGAARPGDCPHHDADDFGVDRRGPNLDGFVLRVRAHGLNLVSAGPPSPGPTSLASAAQPPDERPDGDTVDVQDTVRGASASSVRRTRSSSTRLPATRSTCAIRGGCRARWIRAATSCGRCPSSIAVLRSICFGSIPRSRSPAFRARRTSVSRRALS